MVGSLFHMELTFFKVWGRIWCLIFPYEYTLVLDTINASDSPFPESSAYCSRWAPDGSLAAGAVASSTSAASCLHLPHRECQWQCCPHRVCCCGSTSGSGTLAQPKWAHRVSGSSCPCPPLDKIQWYKAWDLGMSVPEVAQRDQVIQPGIVVGLMLSETDFDQWGIEDKWKQAD